MNYPHFFASPDLSGLGDALLVIGSLIPIFTIEALHGHGICLGLVQATVLVIVEMMFWRLTVGSLLLLRGLYMLTSYFSLNVAFTMIFIGGGMASVHPLRWVGMLIVSMSVPVLILGVAFLTKRNNKR
jgi:hypothetical protein